MKLKALTLGIITCFTFCNFSSSAQKKTDPTLFTYGGKAVSKSEFLRMYTKNINNQKPDFSEKALREYLTLYSRFKMKVAEAEALRMDTLPNIENELGGYKKQLAKTYLTDKDMTNNLVKEAYERMKKDVRVSHILINTPRASDDTMAAYKKADSIYNLLIKGADFVNLCQFLSDDRPSASNGGDIGFFTAMQVLYPFESAAYTTKVGEYSKPFRTMYGYHIIKKTDERPARGEIQVAQILVGVRKSEGDAGAKASKAKADSLYKLLKQGKNFETLVDQFSDDKFSKNTKGVLASFGVGAMATDFENAAFSLKNPGDISEPVKTDFGYHIIKLISKTPVKPFDSLKTELSKRIEKDGRIEVARQLYMAKVKQKLNYTENIPNLEELINAIPDSTLRNGSFKGSDYGRYNKNLFTLNGTQFAQSDFANYIEVFTRGRINGQKESTLRSLYKNYSEKALNDYQENKLIDENEEYRNLLTEYRDGIMLFELTDRSVWSKASADTTGLDKYYQANKAKYMWGPAIKGVIYKTASEDHAKKLVKELNKGVNLTPEEIVKNVNGDGEQSKASFEKGTYEKTRFPAGTKLIAGKYAPYYKNSDGSFTLVDVKEVMDAPSQKTLQEAKGYVISEYQDYLEKTWIADLESKYPVQINEQTLKTMVK